MNKGTKIRTALRIVFSIYTAFCAWQVSINALGDQLGVPWLAAVCAVIIVMSGVAVDVLTTYYNQDYTPEGEAGTKLTRQMKELREKVTETVEEPEDSEVIDDEE